MHVTKRYVDQVLILDLQGSIELPTAAEIEEAITESISGGIAQFLLNGQQLDHLDTVGLALVLRMVTAARQAGGDFRMFQLSEALQRLLHRTSLSTIVKVYRTEQDAVASYS